MKKLSTLLLLFIAILSSHAQVLDPVKWKTKVEKKSDTEFVLVFDATIENEWHMFSQFTPDGGSLPAVFQYKNAKGNFNLSGKTTESPYKKVYSEDFKIDEYLFENKAQFRQIVKITNPKLKSITATIEYQACKQSCIYLDKTFEFKLPEIVAKETKENAIPTAVDTVSASKTETTPITVDTTAQKETVKPITAEKANQKNEKKTDKWSLFLWTLLAGIFVTFTPCVFPMIPMTVSFFLKQSAGGDKAKGRMNALFYGLFIILIYVLISLPFHLFESLSPDIFYDISTNPYLNLFFFGIFVIFAISFLGAFEITIPSKFANKVDSASNNSGLIGVFFMALTLIIVSFSCTGPALGLVIGSVLSTDGGATFLTIAMLGFGIGLALPFMLFALFPSLMGNLPKSGGWLNTVKVVFGFIELALAFKFLSMADLVMNWHILERETFLSIWIALFAGLTLYLLGKLTLPHDSPLSNLSIGRLLLGLVTLAFTIYLIPGLWGAPLNLISGFPPPMSYSESPYGVGNSKREGTGVQKVIPDGAILGPHDIITFHEYDKGLAYAKKVGKPVMIDFTGVTCVNCRRMEELVWSKPEILSILNDKVVLISLFVDDKKELPKDQIFTSKATKKEITTYGKKWTDMALTKYQANVQPYYVLIDLNENNLNTPVGYTPDVNQYKTWLEDGISKFKK